MSMLAPAIETVLGVEPIRITGRVVGLRGLTVLVRDLPLPVGSLVHFPRLLSPAHRMEHDARTDRAASIGAFPPGEVVGFQGQHTIVMMLGQTGGIRMGDQVVGLHASRSVAVGESMLGRVVDGLGRPIDGGPRLLDTAPREIDPAPLSATSRVRIDRPLYTGVRAIDLVTTLGRGQRMGIFAGPGVGKSTLLGSIARNTEADVVVLALIGERGREVQDFIQGVLGSEGLKKAVVVASTSDESPLMRIRAAMTACSIAEFFRDRSKHVLLMMDSITRFAQAQRQVGLSIGEPPASKGYTPSVFANMARLLERAGQIAPRVSGTPAGSVTGLYTILVEGDDMTEPVADAARGILDGHIILSRTLAQRGHYPAIDVLDSVSRVADEVSQPAMIAARRLLLRTLATYRQNEDLIQIGAYARGSSAEIDAAIEFVPRINELLRQDSTAVVQTAQAQQMAMKLAVEINARASSAATGQRR